MGKKRSKPRKSTVENEPYSNGTNGHVKFDRDLAVDDHIKPSDLTKPEAVQTKVPNKKKKIYQPRESLLTTLCSTDKNIEAMYHILILMICVGLGYSLLNDTIQAGKPYVDFTYYFSGFGPIDQQVFSLYIWCGLQLVAFAVHPCFKLWQHLHPVIGIPVDVIFFIILVLYNVLGYAIVIWFITQYNLFPVPSLVINVEQLRFSMKSYSFIRENAYKVLYPWHKDDTDGPAVWYGGQMSPSVGSFSQYFYFLFCPTLLYRDHYPRLPKTRWSRVLSCFLKCCITVGFLSVLTKSIFSLPPTSAKNILSTFLTCCLWGLLYMFMTGYFFLHSWLNLFSELCRFADRDFYQDWWTCHDFQSFYRKWNLLVHDWIKAYIYSDLKDLFNSSFYNKIAFLPTIFISAVFHEYVLWAPLRFILPSLLFLFGSFGSIFFLLRPSPKIKFWNYFLHFGLHFGVSIMIFLYTMEFSSRIICPKEETFINVFIPRFYECFMKLSYS